MAVLVDAITTIVALWALVLLSKIKLVTIRVGYLKILMAITIVVHSSLIHARMTGHSEVVEVFTSVNELLFVAFGMLILCLVRKITYDIQN